MEQVKYLLTAVTTAQHLVSLKTLYQEETVQFDVVDQD